MGLQTWILLLLANSVFGYGYLTGYSKLCASHERSASEVCRSVFADVRIRGPQTDGAESCCLFIGTARCMSLLLENTNCPHSQDDLPDNVDRSMDICGTYENTCDTVLVGFDDILRNIRYARAENPQMVLMDTFRPEPNRSPRESDTNGSDSVGPQYYIGVVHQSNCSGGECSNGSSELLSNASANSISSDQSRARSWEYHEEDHDSNESDDDGHEHENSSEEEESVYHNEHHHHRHHHHHHENNSLESSENDEHDNEEEFNDHLASTGEDTETELSNYAFSSEFNRTGNGTREPKDEVVANETSSNTLELDEGNNHNTTRESRTISQIGTWFGWPLSGQAIQTIAPELNESASRNDSSLLFSSTTDGAGNNSSADKVLVNQTSTETIEERSSNFSESLNHTFVTDEKDLQTTNNTNGTRDAREYIDYRIKENDEEIWLISANCTNSSDHSSGKNATDVESEVGTNNTVDATRHARMCHENCTLEVNQPDSELLEGDFSNITSETNSTRDARFWSNSSMANETGSNGNVTRELRMFDLSNVNSSVVGTNETNSNGNVTREITDTNETDSNDNVTRSVTHESGSNGTREERSGFEEFVLEDTSRNNSQVGNISLNDSNSTNSTYNSTREARETIVLQYSPDDAANATQELNMTDSESRNASQNHTRDQRYLRSLSDSKHTFEMSNREVRVLMEDMASIIMFDDHCSPYIKNKMESIVFSILRTICASSLDVQCPSVRQPRQEGNTGVDDWQDWLNNWLGRSTTPGTMDVTDASSTSPSFSENPVVVSLFPEIFGNGNGIVENEVSTSSQVEVASSTTPETVTASLLETVFSPVLVGSEVEAVESRKRDETESSSMPSEVSPSSNTSLEIKFSRSSGRMNTFAINSFVLIFVIKLLC